MTEQTIEYMTAAEHTARRAQHDAALQQRGVVELQRHVTPGPGHGAGDARIELTAEETILLLEVLWLEEHALGPQDLVLPSHGVLEGRGLAR